MSTLPAVDQVMGDARDALARGVFAKLVLAAPDGADPTLKSLTVRPVVVKGGPKLQLVYRHQTRDVTRNLAEDEALTTLGAMVPAPFRHVHLHTTERTIQVEWRDGKVKRTEAAPTHAAPASTAHDRPKKRVLEVDPRWLQALGANRPDKVRQVHRFVEVLDHWLGDATRPADGRTRWVDVGSGSGVLTFAAWEYLRKSGFGAAEVVGVELRPELAAKTERIARELGCDGLTFVAGAVDAVIPSGDASGFGAVDGVLALHACDTATDDALATGIAAGARWLLAAPCCHKELRPQLAPTGPLAAVIRHGILRSREADIATDALRAALLDAAGFDAKVFEFVSTDHTDKNLMIAAVRRETDGASPTGSPSGPIETAQAMAAFYGITRQRLAGRLGISLEPGVTGGG
ncbi:MAG: SAM-dependent methyltransferase [Myxococcota bacterium]